MKLRKLLLYFIITIVVMTACTPGAAIGPTPQAQTPTRDGSLPPPAVLEAVEALAARLDVSPGLINVRSIEEVEWPDACLGAQKPDEACAEMIVDGYKIVMEVGGDSYGAHTNQDGSQIRLVDEGAKGPVENPSGDEAARAAQEALANQIGVAVDQVIVVSAEAVDWPDSCLGVQRPEETCLAAITPGYKVILEAGGKQYQVNTNADGSAFRVLEAVDQATPEGSGDAGSGDEDQAVEAAKQLLAQQLGVATNQLSVLSSEAVDWPNGCLGIEMPGRMCTQVITPGYRVIIEHAGKTYAFHTDQLGGAIYPAIAPLPQTADKVVVWEQTEDTVCSRVEIGSKGAAFGECGKELKEAPLESQRADELAYLFSTYGSFTSATIAGTVAFEGQGQQQPVEAEMRSIAEWSKLVFMEAQSGRSSAGLGTALSWHREGGIAGFCNDLVIYLSGWAMPSSCKVGQESGYNNFRLSADELTQLYAWVDAFERFDLEQKDNATADSMLERLTFEGSGAENASAEQQEEIISFAGKVYSSAVE